MSYQIVMTDCANAQLMELGAYIAQESGSVEVALQVMTQMEDAVNRLENTPHIGALPRAAQIRKRGYRVLIVGSYLILYLCDDNTKTITVHHIVHCKQDYEKVLF